MPELMPELTTEHRLSVIETDIKYLTKGQDELISLVKKIRDTKCDGSCEVGDKVKALDTNVKTYKKWTWATMVLLIGAVVNSLRP